MTDKIPERRYELTVKFEADDVESLNRAVEHFSSYWSIVASDYMPTDGHSAGRESSFSYRLHTNKSTIFESYRAEPLRYQGIDSDIRTGWALSPDDDKNYSDDKFGN